VKKQGFKIAAPYCDMPQIRRELSKEKNRHALSLFRGSTRPALHQLRPLDAPSGWSSCGVAVGGLPVQVFVWNTEPETFAEPESGGKRKAPANQARGGGAKNIAMM